MRTCRECKKTKAEELFVKQMRNGKPTYRNTCKSCKNAKDKQNSNRYDAKRKEYYQNWKTSNPESFAYSKRLSRWKRLGVDPIEAEKLFAEHNGKCGLCKETITSQLCVDHCHATGKLRDILCNSCNVGLGMFKDSPRLLVMAIDYLNAHTE